MSSLRFTAMRAFERMVGRRALVRVARFALNYARRDLPNRMASNGEWMVQDIVRRAARDDRFTVLDVGAHLGEWSRRLLEECEAANDFDVVVYAFEPSAITYDRLVAELGDRFGSRFVPVQKAASDEDGTSTLYSAHDLAGSNSLHGRAGDTGDLTAEQIDRCRLDEFCDHAGIGRIHLLKVDAEGHDMLVLEGAVGMLQTGSIEVVQFEYNFRWIGARRYLKDAFALAEQVGVKLGKVTPAGIEWYSRWDPELETYREGNYLMATVVAAARFPSISWWAETRAGSKRWR